MKMARKMAMAPKPGAKQVFREKVKHTDPLFDEWKGMWSDWVLAISPNKMDGCIQRAIAKPDLQGYKITKPNLKREMGNIAKEFACGIYEWMASRDGKNRVVYIGSTCRNLEKKGDFMAMERIMEYCHNGSHKTELIEDALKSGYELWVSFKGSCKSCCKKTAEKDENEALKKYDYAWNLRNQKTEIRKIL